LQEASKKEGNKQSQLAALCKKQEAFVVADIAREQRKRARAAQRAAKKERMEARSVCISHVDLEQPWAGPSERFRQEQSAVDRCANMMEAVTAHTFEQRGAGGCAVEARRRGQQVCHQEGRGRRCLQEACCHVRK
jgi:hypothetical protein